MITINEAITNEKERAEKNRNLADNLNNDSNKKQCLKQAKEHEQIAKWLEDYKKLTQETEQDIYERAYKDGQDKGLSVGRSLGYNKAIDDLVSELHSLEFDNAYGVNIVLVPKQLEAIAQQLKEGGTDE